MGSSADNNVQEENMNGTSKPQTPTNNKQSDPKPHRKGGVSAARQRYKKGKS